MPLGYDLEERTARLGENIIKFCKTIKLDEFNRPLINQIIRSATGVGANYMEANGAASKKILLTRYLFVKKKHKKQSTG